MNQHIALWGRRVSLFLAFSLCNLSLAQLAGAAPADFPVPDSLRPAVGFWTKVYTEVDTRSGFLHDPVDMDVIYARLERDSDLIEKTRSAIRDDLKVLASGKRTGLSGEQQRLLALWPADVSNARLAEAADSIRWQLGQSDRFQAGIRRSGAYREYIEEVVLSKGLPIELAALPHVESSFHPGAYSSAAASGMWQFVRGTAQRFMQVDYVVDERLDPFDSTHAAMELLQFNYNALGTWPLALTAYNHGTNGMARAVEQTGSTDIDRIISNYKSRSFGFASRNFYAQFLAVLDVEKRAEELFGIIQRDPRPDFTTVEMPAYVDAQALAEVLGVNVNTLRLSNPALQPSVWSGTKLIPRGFMVKLDRTLLQGDPFAALTSLPPTALMNAQIPDKSYVVRSGDSLSVIANRYDITISELVAINQLRDRNRIRVGQTLLLPQPEGFGTALATANARPWDVPENGLYDVMQGDSLVVIAARFRVSQESLLAFNGLDDPDLLFPGQTLKLREDAKLPGEDLLQVAKVDIAVQVEPVVQESPAQQPEVVNTVSRVEVSRVVALLESDALDEVKESGVYRDSLSLDTDNPALEVNDALLAVEEEQQLQSDLAADPADYGVDVRNTIEVQAEETLGHYADWLEISTSSVRRMNGLSFNNPVYIGDRLKLEFDKVSKEEFERRRQAYHRDLQQAYFAEWHIKGTERYSIRSRDVISRLARDRDVPFWLFRQYNPEVETSRIHIGDEIVFPVVEAVSQ